MGLCFVWDFDDFVEILVKISKFTNQEDILLGSKDIVYQINGLIEMPKPTNRCLSNVTKIDIK